MQTKTCCTWMHKRWHSGCLCCSWAPDRFWDSHPGWRCEEKGGHHCPRFLAHLLLTPVPGLCECRRNTQRVTQGRACLRDHAWVRMRVRAPQGSVGTGVQVLAVSHSGIKLLKMVKSSVADLDYFRVLRPYRYIRKEVTVPPTGHTSYIHGKVCCLCITLQTLFICILIEMNFILFYDR